MKPFIFISIAIGILMVSFSESVMSESRCPKESIPCDDGTCISRDQWCNKISNCPDESDERYCKKTGWFSGSDPNFCNATHFLCKNGICFPPSVQCDGFSDCEDNSDEEKCGSEIDDITQRTTSDVSETTSSTSSSFHPEEEIERNFQNNEQRSSFPIQIPSEVPPSPYRTLSSQQVSNVTGSLALAEQWLYEQRYSDWGWGRDTARVLIALALSNPQRFKTYNTETSLMKKRFQILMAADLRRNQYQSVSFSKLSLYINAMLATCQDPHNFHGTNLVQELRQRTTKFQNVNTRNKDFINPYVYLTLCNVNKSEPTDGYHMVQDHLFLRMQEKEWKDMQAISIMAFSCFIRTPHGNTERYQETLEAAVIQLINRMAPDGSFGDIYSTALAVQALLSVKDYSNWNSYSSLQFLKKHQQPSGSFGDVLATYYILPVLARRSLTDLRNVKCSASKSLTLLETVKYSRVPKHYIRYSVYVGKPVEVSHSIMLFVPINTTFFNVMKIAQQMDPKFRFLYEREEDILIIYSIGNIPNDAEKGMYWKLYQYHNSHAEKVGDLREENLSSFNKDILTFIPKAQEHMIFWYHSL